MHTPEYDIEGRSSTLEAGDGEAGSQVRSTSPSESVDSMPAEASDLGKGKGKGTDNVPWEISDDEAEEKERATDQEFREFLRNFERDQMAKQKGCVEPRDGDNSRPGPLEKEIAKLAGKACDLAKEQQSEPRPRSSRQMNSIFTQSNVPEEKAMQEQKRLRMVEKDKLKMHQPDEDIEDVDRIFPRSRECFARFLRETPSPKAISSNIIVSDCIDSSPIESSSEEQLADDGTSLINEFPNPGGSQLGDRHSASDLSKAKDNLKTFLPFETPRKGDTEMLDAPAIHKGSFVGPNVPTSYEYHKQLQDLERENQRPRLATSGKCQEKPLRDNNAFSVIFTNDYTTAPIVSQASSASKGDGAGPWVMANDLDIRKRRLIAPSPGPQTKKPNTRSDSGKFDEYNIHLPPSSSNEKPYHHDAGEIKLAHGSINSPVTGSPTAPADDASSNANLRTYYQREQMALGAINPVLSPSSTAAMAYFEYMRVLEQENKRRLAMARQAMEDMDRSVLNKAPIARSFTADRPGTRAEHSRDLQNEKSSMIDQITAETFPKEGASTVPSTASGAVGTTSLQLGGPEFKFWKQTQSGGLVPSIENIPAQRQFQAPITHTTNTRKGILGKHVTHTKGTGAGQEERTRRCAQMQLMLLEQQNKKRLINGRNGVNNAAEEPAQQPLSGAPATQIVDTSLQEHQRQLMILEQKNKARLMAVRKEHDKLVEQEKREKETRHTNFEGVPAPWSNAKARQAATQPVKKPPVIAPIYPASAFDHPIVKPQDSTVQTYFQIDKNISEGTPAKILMNEVSRAPQRSGMMDPVLPLFQNQGSNPPASNNKSSSSVATPRNSNALSPSGFIKASDLLLTDSIRPWPSISWKDGGATANSHILETSRQEREYQGESRRQEQREKQNSEPSPWHIIVTNISPDTTEKDLQDCIPIPSNLEEDFLECSFNLGRGRSAKMTFRSEEALDEMIAVLNGKVVNGYSLRAYSSINNASSLAPPPPLPSSNRSQGITYSPQASSFSARPVSHSSQALLEGLWVHTITTPEGETHTRMQMDHRLAKIENRIEVTTTTIKEGNKVTTITRTAFLPMMGRLTAKVDRDHAGEKAEEDRENRLESSVGDEDDDLYD